MERASEGGSFTLDVQSTTGGSFTLNLDRAVTVDQLKKLVSRRLKLSKDRICLLHRERQLREGTLEENGLADGARVILLPSVETGLLSQRTENSVMQALESLNDTQVNDFLSGKSPLNLTMRLGDHTMLIQLQLSTLHPNPCTRRVDSATSSRRRDTDSSPFITPKKPSGASSVSPKASKPKDNEDKYRIKVKETKPDEAIDQNIESQNMIIEPSQSRIERSPIRSLSKMATAPIDESERDTTPTKYVPIPTSVKNNLIKVLPIGEGSGTVIDQTITDPIAANLTSCLCASLDPSLPCGASCSHSCLPPGMVMVADASVGTDSSPFDERGPFLTESALDEYPMENFFNNAVDQGLFEEQEDMAVDREMSNLARPTAAASSTAVADPLPSFQNLTDTNKNKRLHYLLHKTSKYKHPIAQSKQKAFMQSVVNKHIKRNLNRQDPSQPSTSRADAFVSPRKLTLLSSNEDFEEPQPSTSRQIPKLMRVSDSKKLTSTSSPLSFPDTKALIEASKNLTQTLKKLSKEVLINKADEGESEETVRTKTGAVIESMKHHGKGIYSGTFSGTLNPALQDRFGRPKRDISTIIHILNDLLCATPPFTATPKEKQRALPSPAGKADCACAATSHKTTEEKPCHCNGAQPKCGCSANSPCNKCDTARTLANDNSKTKCKVDQLRLVMQQKKQRREARKLQAGPYTRPASPEKTMNTPA